MDEWSVEVGAEDALLRGASVWDDAGWISVTDPDRLRKPDREGGVQTKCSEFMAEFVGNDQIEGKAFVYEEYPDVGVFILQVGERLGILLVV